VKFEGTLNTKVVENFINFLKSSETPDLVPDEGSMNVGS
jgi:ABC-type thiamine transport system substrate-binding protein